VGIAILLLGTSCEHSKNPYHSPKSITKAFAESLYTGKFDEAKQYVTPESIPIINFYKHAFPPENFKGCEHIGMGEITVRKISDSTAFCKCIVTLCNGRSNNSSTKVVKRDGKWYVTLRESESEKKEKAKEQIEKLNN
jgi:hypothetical protein